MFSGRIGALWELFLESFPKILLPGLATTIPLTAISFALALIIAVATALVQFANVKVLRRIARFYIWIFRGTPLLVQLYIVFYGLSRIGIVLAPFPAAVIVFALNEGAYCAETVRGFIDSLKSPGRGSARGSDETEFTASGDTRRWTRQPSCPRP